ncbi:unnamed protein product, partial [Allacma fusca]
SSAYQTEGGYNEGGKGQSNWDNFTHSNPSVVVDRSNGDVAADFYHKYREDIALLKKSGAKAYRFSISWTRILPNGDCSIINKVGDPTKAEDIAASLRALEFSIGSIINPLLVGEYPSEMRRLVDEKSNAEGRKKSRLPTFSSKWKKIITGTLDYIGITLSGWMGSRYDLGHSILITR